LFHLRCGNALHPTPCTLHPTLYTLHPTPYTLQPTPYTPAHICFTPAVGVYVNGGHLFFRVTVKVKGLKIIDLVLP
jgi:hypothetical protein